MKLVYFILILSLLLAACSSAPKAASPSATSDSSSTLSNEPAATSNPPSSEANPTAPQSAEGTGQAPAVGDQVRRDEQGAVTVEVTPANLAEPGEALEFEVELNTHSVDLSMDLAALATLTTDTGKTIQAIKWDASKGGHHVSGKLIFPTTVDGQPVLDGTKKLTLTIKDLDAPERIFSWDLS